MELFVREIRHEVIEWLHEKWDVEVEGFDEMFYRIILHDKE